MLAGTRPESALGNQGQTPTSFCSFQICQNAGREVLNRRRMFENQLPTCPYDTPCASVLRIMFSYSERQGKSPHHSRCKFTLNGPGGIGELDVRREPYQEHRMLLRAERVGTWHRGVSWSTVKANFRLLFRQERRLAEQHILAKKRFQHKLINRLKLF
jgi:hypothetical protein